MNLPESDSAPAISITGFNRMECGVCEDITPFVVDDGTVACADCGVVHLFLTRVDDGE